MDKVSTAGFKEYMRKSRSRMQSLIMCSPTLQKHESNKFLQTTMLSNLYPSAREKSEDVKVSEEGSENVSVSNKVRLFW